MSKSTPNANVKTVLTLLVGLAFGFMLSDWNDAADAQTSSLRGALESAAAPRVSFDGDGPATFSRPLEVPPLYAFDSPLEGDGRQIILVDAETKHICVYWIRPRGANSAIELVAARTYETDLLLENFNGEGLSPAQILEQAKAVR